MTESQTLLLHAIAAGGRLKDHRDIEGGKTYLLHADDDAEEAVDGADVQALVDAGLISSNKKFPAATYWLTESGHAVLGAKPYDATNLMSE